MGEDQGLVAPHAPEKFATIVIGADTAFKAGKTNDYSVLLTAGMDRHGDIYVLDVRRKRLAFPDPKRVTLQHNMVWRGKGLRGLYIEDKASGRNPMFQLVGTNRDSKRPAQVLERILHNHMRRSAGEARIAQFLRDSVKYGYAPTKIVWSQKKNSNEIINFDPRRVFVDPRVHFGDWDAAQFVIFSDFASYQTLSSTGMYPKLKKYPALRYRTGHNRSGWEAHRWHVEEGRGLSVDPTELSALEGTNHWTLGDARVIDEVWFRLQGYEINCPQIDEVWLLATIIDESVCIRFQLNPAGRQYPFVIGALHNDCHKTYGQGLYDILLPMHNIATWLLRSRIDNVQAALHNLIFADPTQIVIPDLIDRNPWGVVRTMPGVEPGKGVYIAQVPDVTRSHWSDIGQMAQLSQRVASASDLQQGMPSGDGIRSATEIQRMSMLGTQRLGMLARILSATAVRPMVGHMVSNIQDALTYEVSIPLSDQEAPGALLNSIKDGYLDAKVQDLQGEIDYLVVDGTLPVEPSRQPEIWLNMLQVMGQTGLNMEFDMQAIAGEAIRSMGIPDLDQFRISKEKAAQGLAPNQQLALMEKARGASVKPEEQVLREAEKGNIVPMRSKR